MASVNIPPSIATVNVSIIDTTVRLRGMPSTAFWGPEIKGFEKFKCVAFAFLVTHTDAETGVERNVLFDLGLAKDWENDLASPLVERVRKLGANFEISKYTSEILEESGMALDTIESIIWSHPHFDHTGRVSLFPSSTPLLMGPGVKTAFYPGYPDKPESSILARDFANREVKEIDFSASELSLGPFRAVDFFDDGSFYLFEAPGHTAGHLNALARTTSGPESTFILMGADSFHHASMLRPSQHMRLPESITLPEFTPSPCLGEVFHALHPSASQRETEIPSRYKSYLDQHHSDANSTPFVTVSQAEDGSSLAVDLPAARKTIRDLQDFDADPNIFVVIAHDQSLLGTIDLFPQCANDWKAKQWKEATRWTFLQDFQESLDSAKHKL